MPPVYVKITKKTKNILDLCTGNAAIPMILSTKTKANIDCFEIQEIIPLETRVEQISEELKYANTIEEKNKYILDAIALKKLIADKKAKRVGGK